MSSRLFASLAQRIVPTDPVLRTMSLSTFINTFGNGLFATVEVIYFTLIMGLS